jgi:hypothetical protein
VIFNATIYHTIQKGFEKSSDGLSTLVLKIIKGESYLLCRTRYIVLDILLNGLFEHGYQ